MYKSAPRRARSSRPQADIRTELGARSPRAADAQAVDPRGLTERVLNHQLRRDFERCILPFARPPATHVLRHGTGLDRSPGCPNRECIPDSLRAGRLRAASASVDVSGANAMSADTHTASTCSWAATRENGCCACTELA